MTTYYTSDLHLSHTKLITDKFRIADSEQQMNQEILDTINSTVAKDDILYILGDITMSNSERDTYAAEWLRHIICNNIQIIKGNHDRTKTLQEWKDRKLISNFHFYKTGRARVFGYQLDVLLSHYPTLDHRCNINLHGHSHGEFKYRVPDLFDVGYDVFKKPVTMEQIFEHYYGDHPNPVSGFLDAKVKFDEMYVEMYNRYEKER